MEKRRFLLGLLLVCMGIARPCFADMIRLDFEGTVTISTFGSVSLNSPFSGYVYYDQAAAPFSEFNYDSGNLARYLAPGSFFITFPGSTIGSGPLRLTEAEVEDHNPLYAPPFFPPSDALRFWFDGPDLEINGPLAAAAQGDQNNYLAFGFFASESALSSTELPAAILGFSQWNPDPPDGGISLAAVLFNKPPFNEEPSAPPTFAGRLTSLRSSTAVPEPSYALAAPLLFAIGYAMRKRKS